ncbi:MAG TPA: hypothetical protein EYG51_03885 [Pseudomonadales bacterium]|nr:hypothetical protein [Pseudomonadales bacterium]
MQAKRKTFSQLVESEPSASAGIKKNEKKQDSKSKPSASGEVLQPKPSASSGLDAVVNKKNKNQVSKSKPSASADVLQRKPFASAGLASGAKKKQVSKPKPSASAEVLQPLLSASLPENILEDDNEVERNDDDETFERSPAKKQRVEQQDTKHGSNSGNGGESNGGSGGDLSFLSPNSVNRPAPVIQGQNADPPPNPAHKPCLRGQPWESLAALEAGGYYDLSPPSIKAKVWCTWRKLSLRHPKYDGHPGQFQCVQAREETVLSKKIGTFTSSPL